MGIRSALSKPLAKWVVQQQQDWMHRPADAQNRWLKTLIERGKNTAFGRDHHLADVRTVQDFRQAVPVRDYEDLKPYVDADFAGRC